MLYIYIYIYDISRLRVKFRKAKMQENELLMTHLLQQTYAGNAAKIRIPNIIVTSICEILVSAE